MQELYIQFRFPAGRYHATPWDSQVNEGEVEWPPSPWRVLRALMSTWHLKARGDVPEPVARSLILKLGQHLPKWELPPAVHAHTRHYMPLDKPGGSAKIFDAFARIDPNAALVARWSEVDFNQAELQALDLLLERLDYLGRSESWVEAARIAPPEQFKPNAYPLGEASPDPMDAHAGSTMSAMRDFLVPMGVEEYSRWRGQMRTVMLERTLAEKREKNVQRGKDPDSAKVTRADERKVDAALPNDIWAALEAQTDLLRKQAWSQPPGTQRVRYCYPEIPSWVPPLEVRSNAGVGGTVARYAIQSAVPPRIITAIRQADKLHRTLAKSEIPILTGWAQGQRLEGHQHAHILCEANDGQTDRITHITVWIPAGIDLRVRQELGKVHRLWSRDKESPIQVALLAVGTPSELAGEAFEGGSPLLKAARHWRSLTPFVPTRHPKFRKTGAPKCNEEGHQIGGPEHDLLRLLKTRGYPPVVGLERTEHSWINGRQESWLGFHHERPRGKGRRGPGQRVGFRIEFAEPVQGPVLAGYGSHYGLGLFVPDGERGPRR